MKKIVLALPLLAMTLGLGGCSSVSEFAEAAKSHWSSSNASESQDACVKCQEILDPTNFLDCVQKCTFDNSRRDAQAKLLETSGWYVDSQLRTVSKESLNAVQFLGKEQKFSLNLRKFASSHSSFPNAEAVMVIGLQTPNINYDVSTPFVQGEFIFDNQETFMLTGQTIKYVGFFFENMPNAFYERFKSASRLKIVVEQGNTTFKNTWNLTGSSAAVGWVFNK